MLVLMISSVSVYSVMIFIGVLVCWVMVFSVNFDVIISGVVVMICLIICVLFNEVLVILLIV